jgi:hypothetical protein
MNDELTLDDVARACCAEPAAIVEWVELGVVAVRGAGPHDWRIASGDLRQLRHVARLARELDLAPYAAVLVRDLIEERVRLEREVHRLRRLLEGG